MKHLKQIVEDQINELKSFEIYTLDYDFVSKFPTEIKSLTEMEFIDIVTCFYMIKRNLTLEKANEEIDIIMPFLNEMSDINREGIMILVEFFDELNENYEEKLVDKTKEEYMSLDDSDPMVKDVQKLIQDYVGKRTDLQVDTYLKWMSKVEYNDIIALAANLKGIKENLEVEYKVFEDHNFKSRKSKKYVSKRLKKDNEIYIKNMTEEFADVIKLLSDYKSERLQEINSQKKQINKKLKNLSMLLKDIENNTLSLENLRKYELDSDLLHLALIELINSKNIKFQKNYEELSNYRQNKVNKLEIIFNTYGYNFNYLTEEEQNILSSAYKEQTIQENLSFISSSSLKFLKENDEAFITIITLETSALMQLDSLLMRNKIKEDFILKYYEELTPLKIGILIENINLLDSQKIDFNLLSEYNDKLLLELNTKLFKAIVAYNINLRSENLKHFEFLEEPKLLNIIDNFIEIGLINQIQTLPNLITYSSSSCIKRIILMQQMNLDYLTDRHTINQSARNGKDFMLSDSDLSDYTNANYQEFMDKDICQLLNTKDNIELLDSLPEEISFIEKYKKNNQVYLIGENYFSRIKVLRCLKTLIDAGYTDYNEILFQSLIYNHPKYLSLEIIEELRNIKEYIPRKQSL